MYQLTSCKEILARVENNFDIDYSDWLPRAPLWIADALDQLQLINSYEDKKITLNVIDYVVSLPDDSPQDIRRILGVEYNGYLIRRLNVINPIKQPLDNSKYNSLETYSIKNGYIVTSFEEGEIVLYYQSPAVEYDPEWMLYLPKVPKDSVIQGAIEWYLIYCMLRKGHKHQLYSLDSKNPITNPFSMWLQESKKAKNRASAGDPEDRSEMSRLLQTFIIDLDRPILNDFRNENTNPVSTSITGQTSL
ncbi:MAG: hypothetical protein M0R17_06940 [Candidatus Omnitrophica bacterium]|jgi:hypothetical protein|nr:hypothetical protein [Candidatus Omnitrophota bacterium]